jgi:hypothetical protein
MMPAYDTWTSRNAAGTATTSPAPNALAASATVGVPLALAVCLAQRGHFCPTGADTMQRGQIGSPQDEQVTRVCTPG